jgi:Mg-chelatase subunit ChlD
MERAYVKRLAWLAFTLLFVVRPCYAARERMDVVLLVDNSGSMYPGRQLPGNDPHYVRATAVQYLLERMSPGDRLALVLFATEPLVPPGAGQLRDAGSPETRRILYDGLKVMASSSREGATRMDLGLRRAAAIIQHAGGERRKRFIILLTDGTPNPQTGNNTYAALTQYARQLGDAGVVVHTIGLGQLSTSPSDATAARRLLEEMARVGGGAYHPAPHADDLPMVFGAIFAQLVGHAISKLIPPGADTDVLLPPGTTDLRLIAVNRGAETPIGLVSPDGTQYVPRQVPPALDEAQEASIATCAIPMPTSGRWRVCGRHGALEVAYEPGFEARLISPPHNSPWPEATPVTFRVRVSPKGRTAPMPMRNGRVTVEYQREPRGRPQVVPLRQVRPGSGEFVGTLDDPGDPGPHNFTVRCFRRGDTGEEEGGPAYAVLQVGAVPALRVAFPQPNARFAYSNPVPVTAQLALGGRPFAGEWSGLRVEATLGGVAMLPTHALLSPSTGGRAVGAISIPRGVGEGKRATLTVALSGTYKGMPVVSQSVAVPLLLMPKPAVQVLRNHSSVFLLMP